MRPIGIDEIEDEPSETIDDVLRRLHTHRAVAHYLEVLDPIARRVIKEFYGLEDEGKKCPGFPACNHRSHGSRRTHIDRFAQSIVRSTRPAVRVKLRRIIEGID